VWRHTWRKNCVNCAVLTGNSAGLRTVLSSRLSQKNAQFIQGIPQFPQFTCRHHDGIISLLAIHSADEHRMIHSFSNATSYCTFYAFFSSFRITLWPMWLANSKRQPCFYPPKSQAQEDTQNWQKTNKPDGKPVLCQRTFSSVFHAVFYTVKLHSFTQSVWGRLECPPYDTDPHAVLCIAGYTEALQHAKCNVNMLTRPPALVLWPHGDR